MKILNLYAGIGGNRKLWGNEHEITAIENNKQIAKIYQDFFPKDKVIVADAHQYLLEHYKEYDFIWSSPPCPTHSRLRLLCAEQSDKRVYPDMRLWQEVIFLKHWFKGKWVIENVISYYDPLIKPYTSSNHYFWSNTYISNKRLGTRNIKRRDEIKQIDEKETLFCFDLENYKLSLRTRQNYLNNCVHPKLGLHVLNCVFKIKQETLDKMR